MEDATAGPSIGPGRQRAVRARGRRLAIALASLATVVLAMPASAVDFTCESVTTVRAFDLRNTLPGLPRTIHYRPVDQTLRLAFDGLDRRRAWTVDVLARGRADLVTGRQGAQDDFDVLYANAAWRTPRDLLGLRIGRQQAVTGLGWHAFDGVRADFRSLRHARFFAFAGFPVELPASGWSSTGSFTWGAGATVISRRHGSFAVDYESRHEEGHGLQDTAGADASLYFGRTSLVANADYSILLRRFGETAAALRHEITRHHAVEFRYTRVQPVLPADTIWIAFLSNPFDEKRISYEYVTDRGLHLGGYYADENYEDTDIAGPEDIDRAAATFSLETARHGRYRGEAGWERGFSGNRLGFRFDSDWSLRRGLRLGGGVSVQRYENAYRLTKEDESYALRARASRDFGDRFNLSLEAEQFCGRSRDTLRGTLVFTAQLGQVHRARPWPGGRWGDAWGPPAEPRRRALPPARTEPRR